MKPITTAKVMPIISTANILNLCPSLAVWPEGNNSPKKEHIAAKPNKSHKAVDHNFDGEKFVFQINSTKDRVDILTPR